VLICLREKEFFHFFFVDQHLLRFLTTKHKRSGPLYYFLPVLLGGLFPWSVFIPRAAVLLWRDREARLFLLWSAVVFLFFSLSGSKLPPYILPAFPALAVVTACLFARKWEERIPPNRELVIYGALFSCLALAGVAYMSGLTGLFPATLPDGAALSKALWPLALVVSITSFGALGVISIRKLRTYRSLFPVLGVMSLVIFTGIMLYSHVIDGFNTTKTLARHIGEAGSPHAVVVNYGSFDETLPFYLKKGTLIANYRGELEMGAAYGDAKGRFLDEEGFTRLFGSDCPVFVVVKEKRLSRLKAAGIEGGAVLGCYDKRWLIANKAAAGAGSFH
jgi:4-amino-4-deoxy-L-arabinose transferase-like glycosyltransferase